MLLYKVGIPNTRVPVAMKSISVTYRPYVDGPPNVYNRRTKVERIAGIRTVKFKANFYLISLSF